MKFACLALVLIGVCAVSVAGQQPVSVTISSGVIVGQTTDGRIAEFLGVPFAEPPLGSLRWRPPTAHRGWASPLTTTQYGPSCIQRPTLGVLSPELNFAPFSEDCLTVNVWAPLTGDGGFNSSAALPVMLFIPGGGFIVGGTKGQDGSSLAQAGPAVVVTAQYRLGVFGFLALQQLLDEDATTPTTGNYGLLDQMFALQWVKKNAAQFGGDASNIMIFGQSAGGNSMYAHLTSPLTAGLMAKVGVESGYFRGFYALKQALLSSDNVLAASGCDDLACLRAQDAWSLQNATQRCQWLPTIDGYVLSDWPDQLVRAGRFNRVPVMIGGVRNEGTLTVSAAFKCDFGPALYPVYTRTLFTPLLGVAAANQVVKQYQPDQYNATATATSSYWTESAAFGDWNILCSSAYFAGLLADAAVPAYVWVFSYPPPQSVTDQVYAAQCPLGAWHGAEIPYVWNILLPDLDPDQRAFQQQVQRAWLNFAAASQPGPVAGTDWPRWSNTSISFNFDMPASTVQNTLGIPERCAFWSTIPIYTPSVLLRNCAQ